MMKKILVIVFFVLLLTACQKTPEAIVKDSVVTVNENSFAKEIPTDNAEKVLNRIPDKLQKSYSSEDCSLMIDAKVGIPDAEILKGALLPYQPDESTIREQLFKETEIKKDGFYEDGVIYFESEETSFLEAKKTFMVLDNADGYSKTLQFDNSNINQFFSMASEGKSLTYDECNETIQKKIDIYKENLQELFDKLGLHQNVYLSKYYVSDYSYADFYSVGEINGIEMCFYNAVGTEPKIKFGGQDIDISDKGINQIVIFSDFALKDSEQCQLVSWDNLLNVLNDLVDEHLLRWNDKNIVISKVELKYMVNQNEDVFEFYPVWSFESIDPANRYMPVFAVNANTGNLEFINN